MITVPPRSDVPEHAGLCRTCRHAAVIVSDRGSVFVRCRRSADDPRFPRYPALPVVACAGWEAADADPA